MTIREISPSKALIQAGWDDVPHLDEDTKAKLLASTQPHLRDARSKGIPSLGAGAIYPIPETEIIVKPFPIPLYWPRAYGLDVGWRRTAAIWMALDQSVDCMYLYTEHYRGQAEPSVHATAIKARGDWMAGVIDIAARGRSPKDGEQLLANYIDLGLNLIPSSRKKAVDAGIDAVFERLSTGRLKVFSTCQNWLAEYRLYRRDENGKIVKENDHCLHPGTPVLTDRGLLPIRELVGTTGRVRTIDGGWAEYRHCRLTGRDQPVVDVFFDDGRRVRCTPDHRFWTTDGWIEARDMLGRACYDEISCSVHSEKSCSIPSSSRAHAKSSQAGGTISAGSIFSEMASGFIEWCGLRPMVGSRLLATTSTIETTIRPTTRQAIWSFGLPAITCPITIRGISEAFRQKPSRQPRTGIPARTEPIGTGGTTRRTATSCMQRLRFAASTVAIWLRSRILAGTGSARTSARPQPEEHRVSTKSSASAPSVDRPSPPTVTRAPDIAADRALLRCLAVEGAGSSDVYCMEVPSTRAFVVWPGVAVHNCMDATRYVVVSGREIATTPSRAGWATSPSGAADRTAGY